MRLNRKALDFDNIRVLMLRRKAFACGRPGEAHPRLQRGLSLEASANLDADWTR
jgi:hypothetical protein